MKAKLSHNSIEDTALDVFDFPILGPYGQGEN